MVYLITCAAAAAALVIYRTEHGCDFLVFYADESMGRIYGDVKYTGGKDGHACNWPGTRGLPPLEIPASGFYFRWVTDGSVSP